MAEDRALFAAGCFWGVEETFLNRAGVIDTQVGYSGGATLDPTYKQVCTGSTGHAEVVLVIFDPEKVTFAQLLEQFFALHDPTQLNRQGPDHGTQYRSAIFYFTPEQETLAQAAVARFASHFTSPIVTEVTAASAFYPAEEYHQKYIRKTGRYCH